MDPTGLAIGAVSLLTLFKTCLELYEAIECGRNLGTDYEVLATKVGIERVRLALWGSVVGLYDLPKDGGSQARDTAEGDNALDSRLRDPRIAKAVSDILNCMQHLFEDSGSLTRKYGLQQMTSGDLEVTVRGNPLKTTFKRTYARLQASASRIQQSSSLVTAVRWAITDKKRFERFVDDLRSFNDSLALLFPDVDANTRTAMAAEIKESTDLDSLQLVENAVSDLAGGEQLAEAASLRITEISQHSKSVAETTATEITDDSIADMNVQHMVRQLQKMEVSMSKRVELRGSLQFYLSSIGDECFAQYVFYGIRNEDFLVERQKKMEYVNPPYQAWYLMYMSDKKRHDQCDFSRQDVECLRTLQGKYPGTHTVDGYIAEFNMWIRNSNPTTEHFFNTIGDLPDISFENLANRVRRIRLQGDRFWDFNRFPDQDLGELIGSDRSGSRMQDQIFDLLSTLNRRRVFPDVLDGASLCAIALSSKSSLYTFLFQVILAHELRTRMLRLPGDWFGNVSRQIVAASQASERWIDGVDVKLPDPKGRPGYFELHSLVHERQVEGLVRFAETMAWPALGEMRRFTEEVYVAIRASRTADVYLTDWLFGLMLPGKNFIYNIMTSLVAATPSLKHLGNARYYISGLVTGDRSYWRVKSVLGRVLGAMKEARAANGWVGPFPRPVGPQAEGIADGWWHVHARDVGLNRFMPRDQPEDGGRFPPFQRREEDSSVSSWVRGLGDRSEWVVPFGPHKSSNKVEFRAVKLKKIGPITSATHEKSGDQDEREPEQRAILELSVNDQPVEFTLYSNPVFVAAPRCVDGPHAVHKQDLPKMQHILSVSELSGHVHNDKRVLIIDATGQGECELAARAWCSENGQHAVLARGNGTCFACAVKIASQGALTIGCVIWVGL